MRIGLPSRALASFAIMALAALIPSAGSGDGAPAWARRIEVESALERHRGPTYSILTVQPLFQDKEKLNTVFAQGSQLRYKELGGYRDTTNPGLGYRRLLFDRSLLAGVNVFFDQEWTSDHRRMSSGGELKWGMLDLYANRYFALTADKSVRAGREERVLGGYDVEMRVQVPYLSWVRIGAKGYAWDARVSNDIRGWTASVDANLSQSLVFEAGVNDDNSQARPTAFMKLTLGLPKPGRPVLARGPSVDSEAFDLRDMAAYRLDKVRRDNRILCEDRPSATGIAGSPPAGVPTGGGCAAHVDCSSNLCTAGVCADCVNDGECHGFVCVAGVCQ